MCQWHHSKADIFLSVIIGTPTYTIVLIETVKIKYIFVTIIIIIIIYVTGTW